MNHRLHRLHRFIKKKKREFINFYIYFCLFFICGICEFCGSISAGTVQFYEEAGLHAGGRITSGAASGVRYYHELGKYLGIGGGLYYQAFFSGGLYSPIDGRLPDPYQNDLKNPKTQKAVTAAFFNQTYIFHRGGAELYLRYTEIKKIHPFVRAAADIQVATPSVLEKGKLWGGPGLQFIGGVEYELRPWFSLYGGLGYYTSTLSAKESRSSDKISGMDTSKDGWVFASKDQLYPEKYILRDYVFSEFVIVAGVLFSPWNKGSSK